MLYFLVWLAVTIWHASSFIKFKYFIFLTHWGFIVWNAYLVVAAITAAVGLWQAMHASASISPKPLNVHQLHDTTTKLKCKSQPHGSCLEESMTVNGVGMTTNTTLSLPLYCKLLWVLFLIGGEYAIAISILYWSLFYDPDSEHNLFSIDSLNLHMINGIIAMLDLWLSGIPVSIYHAIYSIAFGCVYVLFTAVYYMANGTDPGGNRFIYQFLDYSSHPGASFALAIGSAVIFVGIIHYVLFIQYVFRYSITSLIQRSLCIQKKSKLHVAN